VSPVARRARHAVVAFWNKAYEDNLTGLAGMVAYNLLLSVFPLALVALFAAGQVLDSPTVERSVVADLQRLFPHATEATLTDGLQRVRDLSPNIGVAALVASIWVGASFWGALDTAFCRIYHMRCRSWVEQKRFAVAMLGVVILLMAATVAVPVLQSILASGASELPLGLSDVGGIVFAISLVTGLLLLFLALCVVLWAVPNELMPWTVVWPGALAATFAITAVDYAFPVYVQNVSTLASFGGTFVFILVVLLWFYAVAIIILGAGVVNALRYERLMGIRALPVAEPPQAAT
jgi:YihY family inner membrane protein